MKITNDQIITNNQIRTTRQQEKISHPFDEILADIANPGKASSARPPSSVQPAFQVAPVLLDAPDSNDLLQDLDNSLALLESYQSRLSDLNIPVHELGSDIDKLEQEQGILQSKSEALPDDHPLKDLLNQSIVSIAVEVAKFHRGDFH